jgi:hypothetical protein
LYPVSSAFKDAVDLILIEPIADSEIELIVDDVLGFYDKNDDGMLNKLE